MGVQSDTELVSFRDWTLRVRPAARAPARLLLLIHGWTGDENSMWVFVRNFAPDYWIIAPRAPYSTQPGGYSWRPMEAGHHDRPDFDDLHPAVEGLLPFIDAYATENHLEAAQFDAIGFSQGGAMVSTLALLHPDRIGRAAILAGFVPEGSEPLIEEKRLRGKDFFVAHGTQDERVNIQLARASVVLLEQAGAIVTFCEDDVGHKLSLHCLRGLEEFFA